MRSGWLGVRGVAATAVALSLLGACTATRSDERATVATREATTTLPEDPFCRQAVSFNDYIDDFGTDLFVPAEAEQFMIETQRQLGAMLEVAPPETVVDLEIILQEYRRLDLELVEVEYDVAALAPESFQTDEGTDASLRFDNFLFSECGFDPLAGVPFEGDAPEVLSNDELDDVVGDEVQPDDDDVVALFVTQFVEEFGLSRADAECLARRMDRDSVTAIASGQPMTDAMAAEFAATLDACGIGADVFTG